jgi:hypothetical protein
MAKVIDYQLIFYGDAMELESQVRIRLNSGSYQLPQRERRADLRKYPLALIGMVGGCNRPAQTRTEPAVATRTPSPAAESPRDRLLLRQNLHPDATLNL